MSHKMILKSFIPLLTFTQAHQFPSQFFENAARHRNQKLVKVLDKNQSIERYAGSNQNLQILNSLNLIENVWNDGRDGFDVEISEYAWEAFREVARDLKLELEVVAEDVEKLILESLPKVSHDSLQVVENSITSTAAFNYSTYNTYEDIRTWMKDLASEHDFISIETVGETHQKRTVEAIKMSKNANAKKAVIFNTGIHAREWIGPAHLIYIVKMILDEIENSGPNNESEIERFLKNMDIYIIPTSNADGYAFSWTDDRMWRRTRKDYGANCARPGTDIGVDPNRNFPVHWADPGGASDNPCSDTYRGPTAASEDCVQIQIDYVTKTIQNYEDVAYLDVHSYSQLFMYTYGYTEELPKNADILDQIARNVVSAITETYGTKFEYGNIADTIYVATGGSVDTMYDDLGISCTFAPELRDKGRYGFLLPDDQIPAVAEEMYNGYKVLFAYIEGGYCPKFMIEEK